MGPVEAIQSVLQKYVVFSGRASRSEYWWWFLFSVIVSLIAGILDSALGSSITTVAGTRGIGIVGVLVSLALLLPGLAVFVRRLHDTNRSGWWFFIALIPFIGAIVLLVFMVLPGDPSENQYGPPPGYQYGSAAAL